MKKTQNDRRDESGCAGSALTDESIYRHQADRVNCKEQALESDSSQQGRSLRCDKARSRDFVSIQRQPRFGYRPDVPLPTRDYDTLRPGALQVEPLRERERQHAECRPSVHEEFDLFGLPCWTGQASLNVEQSHSMRLLQPVYCNARNTQGQQITSSLPAVFPANSARADRVTR